MNTMDALNDLLSKPAVKDLLDKVVVMDVRLHQLKWIPTDENLDGFREHMEKLECLEPGDEAYNSHLEDLKNLDPNFEENNKYYSNYGAVCAMRTFENGDFESAVSVSDSILDEGLPELSSTFTDWADDYDTDQIKVYISKFFRAFGSHREYDLFEQTHLVLDQHYGSEDSCCCDSIGKPIVYRISYENGNVDYYAIDEEGYFCFDIDPWYDSVVNFFTELDKLVKR